jgi:hypothetical protein
VGLCLKTGEAVEFADADSANELRAAIESQIPCHPSSSMVTMSGFRSELKLSNLIEERMHRGDIQTLFSETISNLAMSFTNRDNTLMRPTSQLVRGPQHHVSTIIFDKTTSTS